VVDFGGSTLVEVVQFGYLGVLRFLDEIAGPDVGVVPRRSRGREEIDATGEQAADRALMKPVGIGDKCDSGAGPARDGSRRSIRKDKDPAGAVPEGARCGSGGPVDCREVGAGLARSEGSRSSEVQPSRSNR
jgi:hypothetical protein